MKRFLILFMLCVCVTTTFSAWGLPKGIDKIISKNDEPLDTEKNRDPVPDNDFTYSFLSGNSNACYVNKASKSTQPSTFWFCGKTTTKCGNNSWFGQDTVYTLEDGKSFPWANTEYYCCGGDATKAGTFKIYQAPTEKDEKYSVGGGTCTRTIKVDVCGKTSVVKPCSVPTECPSGKVVHNKKCVLKCPSGQHFEGDTSDKCVADKLNCSDTQVEHNGKCVEKCTGGKDFESATSDKCVCGSGKVEIGGVCETQKTCSSNEDYIASTNTCKTKEVEQENNDNNGDTPPAEVTYEFLFNDAKSCYVKKPSDKSDVELFWCGKPSTNKCGDYKQSDVGVWSEIDDGDAGTKDNYCCCGGTESKAGEFRKCTTPGTRTKIKKVGGGLCEYTVEVDICNRETVTKDCNTPDPKLSVSGKTPVTKSNMAECGLCTTNEYFKTCALNSCYEKDASTSVCPNKLKQACSIKK